MSGQPYCAQCGQDREGDWLCEDCRPKTTDTPTLCAECRHWGGEPDSFALGPCLVSGSFRAPGGLFTERDFCCCHWTKS